MSPYHQMRYSESRIRPTVNIFQYRTKRQVNSGRDSNLNPGIGTKNIGKGVFGARSAGGARVYFKNVVNGVEIVGYFNKANQPLVIERIFEVARDLLY